MATVSVPSEVFGAAVREARIRRGWTQEQLRQAAGVSRPTIARIERGYNVSTTSVDKVARALELTIAVEDDGES